MKKTLKILVLTLLVSFGFLTGLKAVSCQYEDTVTKNKYIFEIGERSGEFTFTYNGHLLSNYYPNDKNTNVYKEGNYYYFTGSGIDSVAITNTNVSSKGCPTTVYMEEKKVKINKYDYSNFGLSKKSDGAVNMRFFYTYANGNYTILKNIVKEITTIEDENGNSQVVEKDVNAVCESKSGGKEYTAYEFEKGRISVVGGFGEMNDSALNITLCAYSDNSLGIALGSEESTFSLLPSSSSSSTNYVWNEYGNSTGYIKIALRESEVAGLKSAFKYIQGKGLVKDSSKSICYVKSGKVYLIATGSDCNKLESETGNSAVKATTDWDPNSDSDWKGTLNLPISNELGTCETYLGNAETEGTIAYYLQIAFTIIKVVSIIIVIITAMIDLASVITNDKDNLMDTVKKYVKRLIILIIILLLPMFINVLGTIFGLENILCGIK